jgi:4-hydroxy-2-oxoheptanedioate aldolase
MNKGGLLGYAGAANANIVVALQVETASCIDNIAEIAAVPGADILFLGQNDLCMSMGLYEKYEFPHMYTSPELQAATDKLREHARKNNVILGVFLFGTSRVGEFLDRGFPFISIGNDLHHVLTQASAHVVEIEKIAKGNWTRRQTALFSASDKRLLKVGDEVVRMFETDGDAQEVRRRGTGRTFN